MNIRHILPTICPTGARVRRWDTPVGIAAIPNNPPGTDSRRRLLCLVCTGIPVCVMCVMCAGMVWSGYRASDDATKLGYNIPDNMFLVGYTPSLERF